MTRKETAPVDDFETLFNEKVLVTFSTSHGGDMLDENNRGRFLQNFGDYAYAGLVHSANVTTVENNKKYYKGYDSLVTNNEKISLVISVGDCMPVIYYDDKNKALALIHAGWKGLSKNILSKTLLKMYEEYATDPSSLKVFVGPHICQEHYEVGKEVWNNFPAYSLTRNGKSEKRLLSLSKAAKNELLSLGVDEKNIKTSNVCTLESSDYFSHRGGQKERFLVVARLHV